MLCALIMAGGKGTRFWPLSTEEKPKQFLSLIGDRTMIQMTVERINKMIPMERIFVCTSKSYSNIVREQLSELPERNIIIEPEGRNTAPSIALSSIIINRYFKNANMVVLPSDHLINDEKTFIEIVESANTYLEINKEAIVTLGMEPNRAETGYGYIKLGHNIDNILGNEIVKAEKFVEKPNKEKADQYLREKVYLWNGGIFIWNSDNILKQIREYIPRTFEALKGLFDIKEECLQEEINCNYSSTDAISIDYAVLEKSTEVYVIPSNIGWDDIGSWEAINRYLKDDQSGNKIIGKCISKKANNNILISSNLTIYVEGLEDIYVVENDGKIIVGKKENINRIIEFKN